MAVRLVHLRLGVIGHVLAYDETQARDSTPEAERLPAGLILALRRAEVREGDLCQVAVQEADASALIACTSNSPNVRASTTLSSTERDGAEALRSSTRRPAAPAA
jgi:hypothetical protein